MYHPDAGSTLTTPVRVISWSHGTTSHSGADASMSVVARFPKFDVLVIQIPYLAYSCHTLT